MCGLRASSLARVIRAATSDDVGAVAELWAEAQPYRVITAAGLRYRYQHADADTDPDADVSHHVAVVEGRMVGESSLRLWSDDSGPRARISVAVHPGFRRQGAGSALLEAAAAAARDSGATALDGIADPGPGLAFATNRGANALRSHTVNGCDPTAAPEPGPAPAGLSVVPADAVPDPEPVRRLQNATADDDPSGLSEQLSEPAFARMWNSPDHHPELGALVLAGDEPLSCTLTLADLVRGRAWTGVTATAPSARGRGLATLVKAHALRAMAAAGIRQVATGNDDANAAMLAVNRRLGYAPVATVWSVTLPL